MFIDAIMQHTYIYNITWEDPRVDRKLLNLTSNDRIFMLASAGCNVLDYLIESPAQIVACDKNPFQLHLLQLKLAMLRDDALTHEEWWSIWGLSDPQVAASVWARARLNAPATTRDFWDRRLVDIFSAPFSASGSCGWLFKHLLPVVMRLLGLSLDELRAHVDQPHDVFTAWLTEHDVIRRFASSIANVTRTPFFFPMIGVPSAQTEECPFVATPEFWTEISESLLVKDRNFATDNYFYYFFIMGRFSERCRPRILAPEHFDTLKRNVDRVVVHHGLTWDVMNEYEDGHFSRFVLLDHMDWMTNEQIQQEWHIIARKAGPDARVLWRSLNRKVESRYPFFASLCSLVDDVSDDVYAEDRVKMYLGTFVATLPAGLTVPRISSGLSNNVSTIEKLACVANMLAHPIVTAAKQKRLIGAGNNGKDSGGSSDGDGSESDGGDGSSSSSSSSGDSGRGDDNDTVKLWDHRARMDAFYKSQAKAYDSVREQMLSARKALISLMGPFDEAAPGRVWLDIGGGTGRNLRYLSEHFDLFDAIVVVDICAPLLNEGERVAKESLTAEQFGKIQWIRADCTDAGFADMVRRETGRETFDHVTFSYSLSMIPDWRGAVKQAAQLCKGGKMIVADFDTYSKEGSGWKDVVLAKWFKQDGVEISAQRREFLHEELGAGYVKRWTEDGLVPGLGLPHYVYSIEVLAARG